MRLEDKIAEVHNIDFNDLVGGILKTKELHRVRVKILYKLRYEYFLYGLDRQMKYKDIRSLFCSPGLRDWVKDKPSCTLTKKHLEAEVFRVHGIELDKLSRDMQGLIIYNLRNKPIVYNVLTIPPYKVIAYIFGYAWRGTPRRILLEYRERNGI